MKDTESYRVFSKYKETTYVAHYPDENGYVDYSDEENAVWQILFDRQIKILEGRACPEYIKGLELLNMHREEIPQEADINRVLTKHTGWSVEPVPALIPTEQFFNLLANKKFPAATFIRRRDELDYLQEPDIFHEYFGHCPLLTHKEYAEFMQLYGKLALEATEAQRTILLRLYWFTVEFGLIKAEHGTVSYGGGILSSYEETIYAVESDEPERIPFDLITAMRTPYRIDQVQPIYFVIDSFHDLYDFMDDLLHTADEAIALGDFEPKFPTDDL